MLFLSCVSPVIRLLIVTFAIALLIAPAPAQDNVMLRPETKSTAPSPVPTPQFITLERFDFTRILPAPPAPGSLAADVDLETLLQVQAARTPEQIAWAKRIERDNVFFHADVLGAWFTADRLPATAAFFRRLADDMRAVDAASKKPFLRVRPFILDPRVEPCVEKPSSTCYPSGSAMQAFVWATILAEALPAQREALFDRARRAAWGRVIGGVHFPSDVVAGRKLAEAYLAEARTNPAFTESLSTLRREVAAAAATP